MAAVGATLSVGKSILWKIISYGTLVIGIIIILQASIQSSKEKSLRPFISGIGERTLATDSYLYKQVRNLEMNPDKLYYNVKYQQAQQTFGSDATRLQLEIQKLNSRYEKFKFYLSKAWVYIDLLLSIWFLWTIFFIFYWIGGRIIIGHADNVFGASIFALIVFILINSLFTFMLYNPKDYGNKNYMDLKIGEQMSLLNPLKGITSLIMKFPFIIGQGYDSIVTPIETAKDNPNPEISIPAKILG